MKMNRKQSRNRRKVKSSGPGNITVNVTNRYGPYGKSDEMAIGAILKQIADAFDRWMAVMIEKSVSSELQNLSSENKKEIVKMYDAGMSIIAIAEKYNTSCENIINFLNKNKNEKDF